MAIPDPTDAELDEWEQDINALIAQGERRYSVHPTVTSRLIKALRACQRDFKTVAEQAEKLMGLIVKLEQQAKAKDAVFDAVRVVTLTRYASKREAFERYLDKLDEAYRAALDKEVG